MALESLSFGYDALERLDWVSGAYSDDFAYDAQGRLSLKGGASYTYGDASHIHAVTAAGGNSYSYDSNGNQAQRVVGGVTYTLTYDAEGRLIAISGTGLSAEYSYDGDGNRVKSVITLQSKTTTTGYVGDYFEVYIGTPLEPETPSSPNCSVNHCVFFPMVLRGSSVPEGHAWLSYYYAGGQRVAERVQSNQQERVSGLYYLLTDHLGSTTVTLDAGGEVVSKLHYKAWGETREPVDETTTDYRYTSQRWESEIGLYDYKARFYDPYLNRWIQPDSIIPDPYNSLDWDRYAYVRNSPVNYTDPTGHDIDCSIGESGCKKRVKVEKAESLLSKLIQNEEPVTWNNLTKQDQGILTDVGWNPNSFDHSDYVLPPLKSISGTTQDPAVWLVALISVGKLTPASIKLAQQLVAYRGVEAIFAEGFAAAEVKIVNDLIRRTGLDFNRITFWRGTGAPPSYFGSSSPGMNDITLYDSFFATTVDHQLFILKEEYAHVFQLIVEFSDDAIRAAEQAAKVFGQRGH